MNDNIISGIVSGLVVTIFVVVFQSLWKGIILPWFEDRVYKDLRIEGTWYGILPTVTGKRPETITLKRHGHAVTGSMICNAGDDEGNIYLISGSFRNMILTLFYENQDKRSLDRGTITLRCIYNGERFSGKLANYHDETDSIHSTETIWFRSKEEQAKFLKSMEAKKEMISGIRNRSREVEEQTKEWSGGDRVTEDQKPKSEQGIIEDKQGQQDAPATVRNAPACVSNLPATASDSPASVSGLPAWVRDVPADMSGLPACVSGLPAWVRDVPADVRDVPATVRDVPATVSDSPTCVRGFPTCVRDVPAAVSVAPSDG